MPKLSKDEEELIRAASRSRPDAVTTVSRLLAEGVSANVCGGDGWAPPLRRAVMYGTVEVAELLVKKGASLESRDETGATPLHLAACGNRADFARLLVRAGASLEATDERGMTPMEVAASFGYHDLAQQLMAPHHKARARSQRGHLMFSGEFLGSVSKKFMRDTHEQVKRRHPLIPTYIVQRWAEGPDLHSQTMRGLSGMAAMAAFCGSDYGKQTASGCSTYHELKFAYEHQVPIIPIKLCKEWPPTGGDEAGPGYHQNKLVFKPSLVYLDINRMDPAEIADELAKAWFKLFP